MRAQLILETPEPTVIPALVMLIGAALCIYLSYFDITSFATIFLTLLLTASLSANIHYYPPAATCAFMLEEWFALVGALGSPWAPIKRASQPPGPEPEPEAGWTSGGPEPEPEAGWTWTCDWPVLVAAVLVAFFRPATGGSKFGAAEYDPLHNTCCAHLSLLLTKTQTETSAED
eukprot:COSAG04_NODE_34_length_34523_cov_40.302446_9_plen_174_part_00